MSGHSSPNLFGLPRLFWDTFLTICHLILAIGGFFQFSGIWMILIVALNGFCAISNGVLVVAELKRRKRLKEEQ